MELVSNKGITVTPLLTVSYANYLVRRGNYMSAFWLLDEFLRSVCSSDSPLSTASYCGPAFEARENIKSYVVDRWHFRMLNDEPRYLSRSARPCALPP